MPQQVRSLSQKDLPPSVEIAYYRKCIELRRRINDIEENNDATRLRIKRLHRSITKMRLERAFLLQQLQERMEYNVDDSDRSSSPPPTPTDKPLRSKRSHRKTTPPPASQLGASLATQHASPSSSQHHQILQPMNPLSSAQSTPDPGRTNPFFSSVPPSAASPNAVNGTSHHGVPTLTPLQPAHSRASHGHPSYDTAFEDQRAENDTEFTGRRRAHSSTQPPAESANGDVKPDVEMTDAGASGGGFTAVNR